MAFKYIYGTYRAREYDSSMSLGDISLNGKYTVDFFNDGQYKDFAEANITNLCTPIPNDRFTATLPKIDPDDDTQVIGSVPKLTRFVRLRYSDLYTTAEDLKASIEKSGSDTNVSIFQTSDEAIQWITDNTDLVLKDGTTDTFVIHEEYYDDIEEATIPEQVLTIEATEGIQQAETGVAVDTIPFTRGADEASGQVVYPHTLGKIPKLIISASVLSSDVGVYCAGFHDGTTTSCSATRASSASVSSTQLIDLWGNGTNSGYRTYASVVEMTDTSITLNWTKAAYGTDTIKATLTLIG